MQPPAGVIEIWALRLGARWRGALPARRHRCDDPGHEHAGTEGVSWIEVGRLKIYTIWETRNRVSSKEEIRSTLQQVGEMGRERELGYRILCGDGVKRG